MTFEDYQQVADFLTLPINGKKYRIRPVGMADGVRFKAVRSGELDEIIDDVEFNRIFLGDSYHEMVADNVPKDALERASLTALADFEIGRGTAEIIWKTGGSPKAIQQYLSEMKMTSLLSTGEAVTTPTPDFSNDTKPLLP
jgi:hypothetical protein